MIRKMLAAAALAGATVVGFGGTATVGDATGRYAFDDAQIDELFAAEAGWESWRASEFGSWTLGPSAGLRAGRPETTLVGSLGFSGAAKLDSRIGAVYSRLSLSFQQEFEANGESVISGLSGGARNGYYADRSEVDLMTLDADFALRMSSTVIGFVAYDADIDPGSAAEHQIMLRLKLEF